MVSALPRLLVKSRPLPEGTTFALKSLPLSLKPLFPTKHAEGMGVGTAATWHIAELPEGEQDSELWELCYRFQAHGFGFASAPDVEFAEPDLKQQWVFQSPIERVDKTFAAAATEPCKAPAEFLTNYPAPDPFDWRWFQSPQHAGLDAARARLDLTGVGTTRGRVTVAHLDTGYREGQALLPQFLDLELQRSFVPGDSNPNSASDPHVAGFNANPGHGTGTLGILAGARFVGTPFGFSEGLVGGAPFAHVIPVRVANGVVEFANSSIAQGFSYAIDCGVDLLSMSMGGVPAQVWADVVNQAYEAGITLVTAAGNNFGPGKFRVPRFIVYPARFGRVLAACGVMSDGRAYADFSDPGMMGGSYGPDSKMDTAIAGYTPNTPWTSYDCPSLVDFDGAGTSSATPQIAASAACWIQQNFEKLRAYPEKWMRVEAVRKALFDTARQTDREHMGRGTVRADAALDVLPAAASSLTRQPTDSIAVPFLQPVLQEVFGIQKSAASIAMLNLEAAQIISRSGDVQQILTSNGIDPDSSSQSVPPDVRRRVIQAMLDSSTISQTLKAALGGKGSGPVPGGSVNGPVEVPPGSPHEAPVAAAATQLPPIQAPPTPTPTCRRLRVFAFDPALGLRSDTQSLNETILEVPWEKDLQHGPIGEYLEVVDVDPASNACYFPVDLNDPHLLAANGHAPSEAVPQFHQQMVYAVAMTTIGRFERALGRTALWAPYRPPRPDGAPFVSCYVQRLRIYPHAIREANAYYSPVKQSLLFGYFQANLTAAGDNLPGGLIFNCLSHDIVAHETTHALLDGLHPNYRSPTNADMAAFHEAFADIVALFQHFSLPDALRHTIALTRGDLTHQANLLSDLAQQFGQASSGSRALRSGLGKTPSPNDYNNATEAHGRGAVLLAAIFQAFLEMYDIRTADLKRLATGGTGVLPLGDISADLVERLADEAAQTAVRVLTACIRALDYCPPVDLTFGDYLRALVTADLDLEPRAGVNARVAFISAFRDRGIYPVGVRSLSEESLRWQPPTFFFDKNAFHKMLSSLNLSWNLCTDRRKAYEVSESNGFLLWRWFKQNLSPAAAAALTQDLGVFLVKTNDLPPEIPLAKDGFPIVQIRSVRPARRIGSNGQQTTDLVVEMIQRFVEVGPSGAKTTYRGGCTLLIDLEQEQIRYAIRKRVGNTVRIASQKSFLAAAAEGSQCYFDADSFSEPFAMLHRKL